MNLKKDLVGEAVAEGVGVPVGQERSANGTVEAENNNKPILYVFWPKLKKQFHVQDSSGIIYLIMLDPT